MTLQEKRVKKGYSQNDLAVASGVSKRTIQCYEQGTRDINGAHIKALCDLAIALDCKITDLLTDEKLKAQYKMVR